MPSLGAMLVGGETGLAFLAVPLGIFMALRPGRRAGLMVLAAGMATGWLRAPESRPEPPAREETWIWARVTTWRSTPDGILGSLEVYRVGDRRWERPLVTTFAAWDHHGEPGGQWVSWFGLMEPMRAPTNPGERTAPQDARFSARGEPRWGPGAPPPLHRWRQALTARLHHRFPGWAGRLGEAMLLGRSRALTREEATCFRRSGLAHLTAVSGLHVGFVFAVALGVLSWVPAVPRCLMASALALGFAALAGFPPSAVRATVLMGLGLCGGALGRPRPPRDWLVLAAVWITWGNPGLWASLSFQLSISAVLGILVGIDLLAGVGRGIRRWITAPAVSLGAQWGTLPWTVHAFAMVPPLALLPNLMAVPLAGLFVPALGLSLALPPEPAALTTGAVRLLASGIGWIAVLSSSHLPCIESILKPYPWAMALVLGLGLARLLEIISRRAFLVALIPVTALLFVPREPPPGPWICFLDVGQGDAAVFRLSDGTCWVSDVGDDRGVSDAVNRVVGPFLRERNINRVDGVLLSHPHRDHVGAFPQLPRWARIGTVYVSQCYGDLGAGGGAVRVVGAGDRLGRSGKLRVLHPESCSGHSANDASLVVRVDDQDLRLLLTGDVEAPGEERLLSRSALEPVDILKVGHHGSPSSSRRAFLDAVRPHTSVISCGRFNSYGHPDPEVVERLERWGNVLRTDRSGAVEIIFQRGREKVLEHGLTVVPD